ncbi:hypothetical protein D3C80_1531070 [compost metagenome]
MNDLPDMGEVFAEEEGAVDFAACPPAELRFRLIGEQPSCRFSGEIKHIIHMLSFPRGQGLHLMLICDIQGEIAQISRVRFTLPFRAASSCNNACVRIGRSHILGVFSSDPCSAADDKECPSGQLAGFVCPQLQALEAERPEITVSMHNQILVMIAIAAEPH